MRHSPKRTTTSARRKLCTALLGVLAALGLGAYSVFAAGGKADFSIARLAVEPDGEPGPGDATYIGDGDAGRTDSRERSRLSAGPACPAGATASWKLCDGTSSNVVPPNLNSATLDDPDRVEHSQRHLAAADHRDQRQALRYRPRSRWSSSRRRSRTSLSPASPATQTVSGRPVAYGVNVQSHRRLQRRRQPERQRPAQGRDRLLEPEQHGFGLELQRDPADPDRRQHADGHLPALRSPAPARQRQRRLAIRHLDVDRPEEPELPDRRRSRHPAGPRAGRRRSTCR